MPGRPQVYVALDTADLDQAVAWAKATAPHVGGFKAGLEFFVAQGPTGIARLAALGRPLFLDLKLHDIPATVGATVRAACRPGIALLTVHASGGPAMLAEAVAAARATARAQAMPVPKLLGVTVLTSLDASDLEAVGQAGPPAEQVLRLARLGREQGLAGLVCSPQEVALLRRQLGPTALLVVPGIRPASASIQDQKRSATPAEAARAGADILVIGRPITASADPAAAAAAIACELAAVPD